MICRQTDFPLSAFIKAKSHSIIIAIKHSMQRPQPVPTHWNITGLDRIDSAEAHAYGQPAYLAEQKDLHTGVQEYEYSNTGVAKNYGMISPLDLTLGSSSRCVPEVKVPERPLQLFDHDATEPGAWSGDSFLVHEAAHDGLDPSVPSGNLHETRLMDGQFFGEVDYETIGGPDTECLRCPLKRQRGGCDMIQPKKPRREPQDGSSIVYDSESGTTSNVSRETWL